MDVGIASPTIPVANDVIQGVFNVYVNYGLPTETLLGATQSGCKLALERKIEEIKSDGTYGYQLDSDGVPLVRYKEFIARIELEQLYLKYFNRKIISDCEVNSLWKSKDWSNVGGLFTPDTTNILTGNQSVKCTASVDKHGVHEAFTLPKDLTVFDNKELSSTSDYIGFAIYISAQDLVDLGKASIRVAIHNDLEGTETNLYYYDVAPASLAANCWNPFKILKSEFKVEGSPTWTGVTGISFKLQGEVAAEVTFNIDDISLIQAQTNSAIVPVNGGGFKYTNNGTYREFIPALEILESDYLENVTLVCQKMDGKKVKIILTNCLNDGKIDLAFKEKNEVVNKTTFTGHYRIGAATIPPIRIREYV